MFSLSPVHSACKSTNHKLFSSWAKWAKWPKLTNTADPTVWSVYDGPALSSAIVSEETRLACRKWKKKDFSD